MEKCNIPFESLVNYVEGITTPAEAARIEAHLVAGCPACTGQIKELRHATEVLREVFVSPAMIPSESARAFAKNLTRLRFNHIAATAPADATDPSLRHPFSGVPRWVARYIQPETSYFVGARSTPDLVPAQRIFETNEHLVTLWEEANIGNTSSYVIGQVYSRLDNVSLIPELVLFTAQADGTTFVADKEDSEFYVSFLLPGEYVVHCWLNDNDVLALPHVRFGSG